MYGDTQNFATLFFHRTSFQNDIAAPFCSMFSDCFGVASRNAPNAVRVGVKARVDGVDDGVSVSVK